MKHCDTGVVDRIETVNGTGPDAAAVRAVPLPQPAWERALPWVMALVFAAIYSVFALARFERPTAGSFDLGIFEQAIRHYAHLQAPIVDLEGAGHNYLGDHWNPAIAVFAPFYRLFPGPQTLLLGQAVLIALAVAPITRAGMRHLGRWSGIAVGLAFGLSYGIQGGLNFEIHGVCLAVPLLAFALEAYLAGRWKAVAAWSAPLVLVQEDLGLTVFMLGLVLVLVGARRWGAGLAAFGLASFALTMTVLIPHFSDGDKQSRLAELAAQPGGSLLQRTLGMPLDVVTSVPKATTVLLLLAVTVFIATQSPLLVIVLPTLAWRFIVNDQTFWGQGFHYDLMLMPIVFAALIDGVRRARRDSWRPLREYARAAPLLALLVALFLCTRYQFRDLVNPVAFSPAPRTQAAERVLSAIPDGVTIETDLGLMRKLTQRTRVFYVGNAAPVVPEYLLVNDEGWKPPLPDVVKYAESLHPGKRYVLVSRDDGYTLVRRVS